MDSDENIRHCLAADADGNIISVNHREGVINHLSEAETATSLKRAAEAWKGRKELASKIGKGLYAVAAFEKITRITFPLGEDKLLFVSLGSEQMRENLNAGGQQQIVQHVLNILSGDPTLE
ncbi:MAG: hypothetical protein IH813_03705 [Thaumarchaeota archaeon]|nr:hypothetical protein [Nitrososphaerota archaeon]